MRYADRVTGQGLRRGRLMTYATAYYTASLAQNVTCGCMSLHTTSHTTFQRSNGTPVADYGLAKILY